MRKIALLAVVAFAAACGSSIGPRHRSGSPSPAPSTDRRRRLLRPSSPWSAIGNARAMIALGAPASRYGVSMRASRACSDVRLAPATAGRYDVPSQHEQTAAMPRRLTNVARGDAVVTRAPAARRPSPTGTLAPYQCDHPPATPASRVDRSTSHRHPTASAAGTSPSSPADVSGLGTSPCPARPPRATGDVSTGTLTLTAAGCRAPLTGTVERHPSASAGRGDARAGTFTHRRQLHAIQALDRPARALHGASPAGTGLRPASAPRSRI